MSGSSRSSKAKDLEGDLCSEPMSAAEIRKKVKSLMEKLQFHSALFWADKLVSLSKDKPSDVYLMASCLIHLRQFERAAEAVKRRGLHLTNLACRYAAVLAYVECREFDQAMQLVDIPLPVGSFKTADDAEMLAAFEVVKGRLFETLDDAANAAACYREALIFDCCNAEALHLLVDHQLLSGTDEAEILTIVGRTNDFVRQLYAAVLKKYDEPVYVSRSNVPALSVAAAVAPGLASTTVGSACPAVFEEGSVSKKDTYTSKGDNSGHEHNVGTEGKVGRENCEDAEGTSVSAMLQLHPLLRGLETNIELLAARAEQLFYNCDYKRSSELVGAILDKDPLCPAALELQIACHMELHQVAPLYLLAHRLVDSQPENVLSWYAVGCYYYTIRKAGEARKYLEKATTLRPSFGPAWLLFGHAYAIENEHDQAMAAYFKASHLMPGNHLPTLYVGLEYHQQQGSCRLAERFFEQARVIAPRDPFVSHELGVAAYDAGDLLRARDFFEHTLKLVCAAEKPPQSIVAACPNERRSSPALVTSRRPTTASSKRAAAISGNNTSKRQSSGIADQQDDDSLTGCVTHRTRADNLPLLPEKWEPLMNNLGHVYRRLGELTLAIGFYRQALVIRPACPSTLANLGFAYALQADWHRSIDHFHQALAENRDDTFSTTMLQNVLEMMAGDNVFDIESDNVHSTLLSAGTMMAGSNKYVDSVCNSSARCRGDSSGNETVAGGLIGAMKPLAGGVLQHIRDEDGPRSLTPHGQEVTME